MINKVNCHLSPFNLSWFCILPSVSPDMSPSSEGKCSKQQVFLFTIITCDCLGLSSHAKMGTETVSRKLTNWGFLTLLDRWENLVSLRLIHTRAMWLQWNLHSGLAKQAFAPDAYSHCTHWSKRYGNDNVWMLLQNQRYCTRFPLSLSF